MSREVHVRFSERQRVKLSPSTQPCIRLRHGFVYLVAIMDWYSRYVLSWELSLTLETDLCVAVLNRALKGGGSRGV